MPVKTGNSIARVRGWGTGGSGILVLEAPLRSRGVSRGTDGDGARSGGE